MTRKNEMAARAISPLLPPVVFSYLTGKGLRQQLLQLIKSRCHRVAPTKRLQVTPDPDDDIFLDWRR